MERVSVGERSLIWVSPIYPKGCHAANFTPTLNRCPRSISDPNPLPVGNYAMRVCFSGRDYDVVVHMQEGLHLTGTVYRNPPLTYPPKLDCNTLAIQGATLRPHLVQTTYCAAYHILRVFHNECVPFHTCSNDMSSKILSQYKLCHEPCVHVRVRAHDHGRTQPQFQQAGPVALWERPMWTRRRKHDYRLPSLALFLFGSDSSKYSLVPLCSRNSFFISVSSLNYAATLNTELDQLWKSDNWPEL